MCAYSFSGLLNYPHGREHGSTVVGQANTVHLDLKEVYSPDESSTSGSKRSRKRQSLDLARVFESSKGHPSNIFPVIRLHLLIPIK